MKFALILLSALVVISHQQFQRRQGNLLWWSPYGHYAPQPMFDNYPSVDFNDIEEAPAFRYFRPRPAITYHQQFNPSVRPVEDQGNMEEYPDVQSRYRSSFLKNQKERFFFSSSSLTNLIFKTATFTLTSTISLTSMVNCVPSTQFAAGSANVICRRKRNIPLLTFDDDSIEPSETLKVKPTEIFSTIRENRQLSSEETPHHGIDSSIEDQAQVEVPASPYYVRDKRFFFNYLITSTTVTSYSFVSTTVTKTVNLLPSPTVSPNLLQCRPSNFVVC